MQFLILTLNGFASCDLLIKIIVKDVTAVGFLHSIFVKQFLLYVTEWHLNMLGLFILILLRDYLLKYEKIA